MDIRLIGIWYDPMMAGYEFQRGKKFLPSGCNCLCHHDTQVEWMASPPCGKKFPTIHHITISTNNRSSRRKRNDPRCLHNRTNPGRPVPSRPHSKKMIFCVCCNCDCCHLCPSEVFRCSVTSNRHKIALRYLLMIILRDLCDLRNKLDG